MLGILYKLWVAEYAAEGQQLRYAGNGMGYEDVIIDGSPTDMKVSILSLYLAQD